MNNYYEIHSWSTQYRQERLTEARAIRLEGRLREDRRMPSRSGSLSLALANLLSQVRGA